MTEPRPWGDRAEAMRLEYIALAIRTRKLAHAGMLLTLRIQQANSNNDQEEVARLNKKLNEILKESELIADRQQELMIEAHRT